jgi:hypothetical protein
MPPGSLLWPVEHCRFDRLNDSLTHPQPESNLWVDYLNKFYKPLYKQHRTLLRAIQVHFITGWALSAYPRLKGWYNQRGGQ